MATFHRTQRLEIYGKKPEVTQLFGSRYRIVVRCKAKNETEAWYQTNKSQIFADFGTLYSDQMSVDGIDSRTGEAYPDMVLVQHEAGYTQTGEYVITFVYETLTSSFVQESEEKVDQESSGLRRVTRSVIAKDGATYGKTVGTTTLTHSDHGYGSTTLVLAAAEEDAKRPNENKFIRIRETWIEPGVLNVSIDKNSPKFDVSVQAIKFTAAEVRAAVPEVTTNHNLRSEAKSDFNGLTTFRYDFEVRSTSTATELGDPQIGVKFDTGLQTDGSSDFVITRQYAISSVNVAGSIKQLIPPEITDPVFDGTGGTNTAHLVDQQVTPNGQDGAVLTRTFAMVPTQTQDWDELVVRFPGVSTGPFQLDENFAFRSQPFSEAVPVRIVRDFFLSNPQRIHAPAEFRPVDESGNRTDILSSTTVPTADEYIGFVNSGKFLNDRVSIHRWQGDIWERRIVQFVAK